MLKHGLYYGDRGRRTRTDGTLEAFDTAVHTAPARDLARAGEDYVSTDEMGDEVVSRL